MLCKQLVSRVSSGDQTLENNKTLALRARVSYSFLVFGSPDETRETSCLHITSISCSQIIGIAGARWIAYRSPKVSHQEWKFEVDANNANRLNFAHISRVTLGCCAHQRPFLERKYKTIPVAKTVAKTHKPDKCSLNWLPLNWKTQLKGIIPIVRRLKPWTSKPYSPCKPRCINIGMPSRNGSYSNGSKMNIQ
jgi:hypothetical protein